MYQTNNMMTRSIFHADFIGAVRSLWETAPIDVLVAILTAAIFVPAAAHHGGYVDDGG